MGINEYTSIGKIISDSSSHAGGSSHHKLLQHRQSHQLMAALGAILIPISWFNFNTFRMLKTKSKRAHTAPKGKKKRTPGDGNLWAYKDKLELFPEARKLTRSEVLQIESRDRYKIRTRCACNK